MNAKMFSYKVEGILLEQHNHQLKLSKTPMLAHACRVCLSQPDVSLPYLMGLLA